jgi:hypothetical protein
MAYQWIGENWGRSLLLDAAKEGFTFDVHTGGDEADYTGTEPLKAWEAVTAVDEAKVYLSKPGMKRSEWAFMVLDYNQNGDEVINDHSTGGWIEQWWDAKSKAAR